GGRGGRSADPARHTLSNRRPGGPAARCPRGELELLQNAETALPPRAVREVLCAARVQAGVEADARRARTVRMVFSPICSTSNWYSPTVTWSPASGRVSSCSTSRPFSVLGPLVGSCHASERFRA